MENGIGFDGGRIEIRRNKEIHHGGLSAVPQSKRQKKQTNTHGNAAIDQIKQNTQGTRRVGAGAAMRTYLP